MTSIRLSSLFGLTFIIAGMAALAFSPVSLGVVPYIAIALGVWYPIAATIMKTIETTFFADLVS